MRLIVRYKMDTEKIQSDSFMTKPSNYETIESYGNFFNQQYELRLELLNKSVEELKVDGLNKYNQLSNRVNKVDDKLEDKYEKILEKIDSKYDRVEQRVYNLFYGLIFVIVTQFIALFGKYIWSFLFSQS